MSHYEIGQWVDMVRGLVTERKRAEMSAHVNSGCQSCSRTLRILLGVAKASSVENRYQVPLYVVNGARAIFALQRPERVYLFPRIVGRLVYDSFKEPLPAGLRARHRLTRHALYEAGDFSVDIRLEHQPGTPSVTLVGQIVNRSDPGGSPAGLPVYLVSGGKCLVQSTSNDYGEFQFEYRPRRHLRLYMQGNQRIQNDIELPLDRFAESSRKAKSRRTARKKRPN